MKNSMIALLTIATLTMVSCKKDKEETQAVTKENISGTYKLGSVKGQVSGGAEQDVTSALFESCELDNATTLKTDLTYTVVDAGTQCSPATDESGTWGLSGTTGFVLDGESFTIKSWNGSQLVLTQTDNSGGVTATYTTTLNKQ